MLRTRLWMGTILIGLTVGALVFDERYAPWYPFFLVIVLGLALVACHELLALLDPEHRPMPWLCYTGVAATLLANWAAVQWGKETSHDYTLPNPSLIIDPWPWLLGTFVGVVLLYFLAEMAFYREPGKSVARIALATWMTAYLGLLPCFLAQLRWLEPSMKGRSTMALALAIFVPKCCDSGAYFTGRLIGRHKMTPVLSPKKTWEGAAGGLLAAVLATFGINRLAYTNALHFDHLIELGFGLTVGIAAIFGDLAESLIKRDCQQKDASQIMPGFGGVLDVVDSIIFAAPVAYWWLK